MQYTNRRNPVLPVSMHVPDGEAHMMSDGGLYIYGSYDDRENEYCSGRYFVVSTSDMEHWKVSGESFGNSDIPWLNDPDAPKYPGGIDWLHPSPFIQKMIDKMVAEMTAQGIDPMQYQPKEGEPLLYAPDCIEKDGKYYLYFCLNDGREGVAVSDSPEGPFTDPLQLPCGGIDPAIFIDDDGQAYYYWGQVHANGVKLNPDMVSFDEKEIVSDLLTEEEHHFHEGTSVRKIGDAYYCVFADVERGRPTALGYATGKSPLGPFTYRGIIIDNAQCDPASWNNHGSIECFNGQWYVFYHRSSRGTEQSRRLCIEPIEILPDGTIPEVKMTSQGAGMPFKPGEDIMGYQACELKGSIYIAPEENGEESLMNISDGDEAVFRYVESTDPYKEIMIEAQGSGTVEIFMDEDPAGKIRIKDGVQEDTQIDHRQGKYELTLKFMQPEKLEVKKIVLG